MIVVALDAPFDGRQLARIARRAVIGMRGAGADFSNGSGDYVMAFTTGAGEIRADDDCSGLFHATMLAVEEALINSILRAETRTGPEGRVAHAIPTDSVRERLEPAGAKRLD